MHRSGAGPDSLSVRRPFGLAAGTIGLALAWLGGAAIVQLTGAVAVLVMLAVGLAAATLALAVGWFDLARVTVAPPRAPAIATQGVEFPIEIPIRTRRPVWVEVRRGDEVIATGWSDGSVLGATATTRRRGTIDELDLRVRSAGVVGLLWWYRSATVAIEPLLVAARLDGGRALVERTSFTGGGDRAGRTGAIAGEIDGVRPWRDGDSEKFVHWASTLRVGELVVHDRRLDAEERWVVRARYGLPEPDIEAGVVRNALEAGRRAGAVVFVAIGDGTPEPIRDAAEAGAVVGDRPIGAAGPLRPSTSTMGVGLGGT